MPTPRFPITDIRVLIAHEMSKHALYHPPQSRGRYRAVKRSRVRVARTLEDQFLLLFSGLPARTQQKFIEAPKDVQDAVWRDWTEVFGSELNVGAQFERIVEFHLALYNLAKEV